jgi:hypothetical protein
MKNIKHPVTCEVYLNGMLHRVYYESRVIHSDKQGRFVRDQFRNKRYLKQNNTYRVDWREITASKLDKILGA